MLQDDEEKGKDKIDSQIVYSLRQLISNLNQLATSNMARSNAEVLCTRIEETTQLLIAHPAITKKFHQLQYFCQNHIKYLHSLNALYLLLSSNSLQLPSDPYQTEEGIQKVTCCAIEDFAYSRYNMVRTNAQYCKNLLKHPAGIELIKQNQRQMAGIVNIRNCIYKVESNAAICTAKPTLQDIGFSLSLCIDQYIEQKVTKIESAITALPKTSLICEQLIKQLKQLELISGHQHLLPHLYHFVSLFLEEKVKRFQIYFDQEHSLQAKFRSLAKEYIQIFRVLKTCLQEQCQFSINRHSFADFQACINTIINRIETQICSELDNLSQKVDGYQMAVVKERFPRLQTAYETIVKPWKHLTAKDDTESLTYKQIEQIKLKTKQAKKRIGDMIAHPLSSQNINHFSIVYTSCTLNPIVKSQIQAKVYFQIEELRRLCETCEFTQLRGLKEKYCRYMRLIPTEIINILHYHREQVQKIEQVRVNHEKRQLLLLSNNKYSSLPSLMEKYLQYHQYRELQAQCKIAICKGLNSLEKILGNKAKIVHILRCYGSYFWRMKLQGVPSSEYKELWGYLVDCQERMARRTQKCIRKTASYLRNVIFDQLSNRRTNIHKKMKLKAKMLQNIHTILCKHQRRFFVQTEMQTIKDLIQKFIQNLLHSYIIQKDTGINIPTLTRLKLVLSSSKAIIQACHIGQPLNIQPPEQAQFIEPGQDKKAKLQSVEKSTTTSKSFSLQKSRQEMVMSIHGYLELVLNDWKCLNTHQIYSLHLQPQTSLASQRKAQITSILQKLSQKLEIAKGIQSSLKLVEKNKGQVSQPVRMLCAFLVVIKKVAAEVKYADIKEECNIIIEKSLLKFLNKKQIHQVLGALDSFPHKYVHILKRQSLTIQLKYRRASKSYQLIPESSDGILQQMEKLTSDYFTSFIGAQANAQKQLEKLRTHFQGLNTASQKNVPHMQLQVLSCILAMWYLTAFLKLASFGPESAWNIAAEYCRPHRSQLLSWLIFLKSIKMSSPDLKVPIQLIAVLKHRYTVFLPVLILFLAKTIPQMLTPRCKCYIQKLMKNKYDFWQDFIHIFREEAQLLEQKKEKEDQGKESHMNPFQILLKDLDPNFQQKQPITIQIEDSL